MTRILTYNVHHWVGGDRRADPGRIAAVIAAARPDIVALQEVRIGRARDGGLDQAGQVAAALGMDLFFQPTAELFGERFGLAILTARPARLMKRGALPNRTWGPVLESRSALWVEVETQAGPLQVVTAHLSVLNRRESVAQAVALLGPDWLGAARALGPSVLLGDFNAPPSSTAYRRLAGALCDAQASTPVPTRQATFPARRPFLRIDHVFMGEGVSALVTDVIRTPLAQIASDHLPVLAELQIAPVAVPALADAA